MTKLDTAILLAGYTACGKSTALDVCMGYGDIFCYEMSTFVRNEFQKESDEGINDNDLGTWAAGKKDEYGNGYFADSLTDAIDEDVPATKSVAISGIRSPEEVTAVIESGLFESVTVIGIVANESVRWERYSERPDASRESFNDRNVREADWGVDAVIRYADVYMVNNWTTEERFRTKVEQVVEDIRNGNKVWV